MAIDNRLQVFNEEGQSVDYDILASDVKFSDGKDLPTKLDELEDEIGEGGYTPPQGGIPATDLAPAVQTSLGKADTAYQKPASGIPASDIASGVIPDVSQLATKTEVSQKANSADVYTKAQVDQAIEDAVEDIPAGQDGITPHIGQNGNWYIGNTDTGIKAQGPAGESITDADLTIGNALNGQGDVLGMQGAMQMKANIDSLFTSLSRLYSKLGNMAFWDAADKTAAAPTALDWQVPQVTVTLDKTGLSANAMITNANDQEITGTSVSVDQGSGLTLKIMPKTGYAITAASATIAGVSQNLTESGGIYTLALTSVTSAITIVFSVTAAAAIPITIGTLTHCVEPSGVNPDHVLSGQSTNIVLEVDSGYELTSNGINISGATVGTITHSGNVYTIPITHDGTSQSISFSAAASVLPMRLLKGYYIGTDNKTLTNDAVGDGTTVDVNKVVLTDYIHIEGDANSSFQKYIVNNGVNRNNKQNATAGPPCIGSFFRKQNGTYKLISSWGWQGTSASRTVSAGDFSGSSKSAELLAALQANELYVRVALYLSTESPAALVSSCSVKWGNDTLFQASDDFDISTDPSDFDTFTTA